MRALALAALLIQEPGIDLEWEYRAIWDDSPVAMITLIARYPDGSPVRGYISCAGSWFKHQDDAPDFSGDSLPFRTDARGAVIMNPHLSDGWISCWSEEQGYYGKVTADFDEDRPTGVYEMVMERQPQ